jgi:3-methyladenine DNA glycosylase AlkD
MARFGINPTNRYGVSIPNLRALAKRIGKDHGLAAKLWATGVEDARILASMIDETAKITSAQMERWAQDFNSWDVCDQVCSNLFGQTRFAHAKALAWSRRRGEFVKRAGFTLMACLAVHDKEAPDAAFEKFLPRIKAACEDDRNFVKKAVNWALRQIGKRNAALNGRAIAVAREIQRRESRAARWIASDALRELTNSATRRRIMR